MKKFFICFFVTLFLSGCTETSTHFLDASDISNSIQSDTLSSKIESSSIMETQIESINQEGNNFCNIATLGFVTEQGDYYFYSDQSNKNPAIYKVNKVTNEKETLVNYRAYSLNIIGDYLYFNNVSDNNKLYKLNIRTKEFKILTNYSIEEIYVDASFIYCLDSQNNRIVKMNLDGNDQKILVDYSNVEKTIILTFRKYEDKIIYQIYSENYNNLDLLNMDENLIVADTDGNQINIIPNIIYQLHYFVVKDDLYYLGENSELCQYNISSKKNLVLTNNTILGFVYFDGKIYYIDKSNNNHIYGYDIESKTINLILAKKAFVINVFKDDLFFTQNLATKGENSIFRYNLINKTEEIISQR